ILFDPDGRRLLLGCYGGVQIHDLQTRQRDEIPLGATCNCDQAPDGRIVFVQLCCTRPKLFCRRWDDLTSSLWSITSRRSVYSGPYFLASGDRFLLLEWVGRHGGISFVIRDASTGRILTQIVAGREDFYSTRLTISSDRRRLATWRATRIGIFQTDDLGAEPVLIRNDNRREFTSLAFHPSGRFLAATSNDATVKLYDTRTWKLAHAFDWEIGRLRSVAFSPDGTLAAAGGDKGKIVVWDFDL